MRFALTEEQEALQSAVAGLIERRLATVGLRASLAEAGGYDAQLWCQLCDQIGVASLAIPEAYGGAGFTSFETHLVLEQLGRCLTPGPLLSTSGASVALVAAAESGSAAAADALPGLAAGTTLGTVAWSDASGRPGAGLRASRDGGGWLLTGRAATVLGPTPDLLVAVATGPDGPMLFLLDDDSLVSGWTVTPALDPTLQLGTVVLDRAPATDLVVGADGIEMLGWRLATAVTALQVGGAAAALEQTVAYLGVRHQFGRPLGSFQALKHRVADLLVQVEAARSVSWAAAWAAVDGTALERPARVAKAWCSDAFAAVTSEMIQLHGGIAITWEHDAHLYFKRAHATAQLFGTAALHRHGLLGAAS